MKRVAVVYHQAADLPCIALDGRTPLEVARCPYAAELAASGEVGLVTPPPVSGPCPDEIQLSALCGAAIYEAVDVQRGPLEALLAADVPPEWSWVYSGSFVTLGRDLLAETEPCDLSIDETRALTAAVTGEDFLLRVIGPGRVAVFLRESVDGDRGAADPSLYVGSAWRKGFGLRRNGWSRQFMKRSRAALEDHSVNEVRLDLKQNPANAIWLWGGGPRNQGLPGSLPNGLIMGSSPLSQAMAASYKAQHVVLRDFSTLTVGQPSMILSSAMRALHEHDRIMVLVTPPHGGDWGSAPEKVRALESIDQHVLGPLLQLLKAQGAWRMLLTSLGAFSSDQRLPVALNLPFVLAGEGVRAEGIPFWNEEQCGQGARGTMKVADLSMQLW